MCILYSKKPSRKVSDLSKDVDQLEGLIALNLKSMVMNVTNAVKPAET